MCVKEKDTQTKSEPYSSHSISHKNMFRVKQDILVFYLFNLMNQGITLSKILK